MYDKPPHLREGGDKRPWKIIRSHSIAVLSQEAVSAHFTSKQILPFDYAQQSTQSALQNVNILDQSATKPRSPIAHLMKVIATNNDFQVFGCLMLIKQIYLSCSNLADTSFHSQKNVLFFKFFSIFVSFPMQSANEQTER